MKFKLLTSVATASLVLAGSGAASAQDNTSEPAAQQGIQEIVVTAQRRAENVQKSSLSIQVVSASDLVRKGVSEARDLAAVTPSISISQAGPFTQTNIRGAGDFAGNGLSQPAVTYSIDGVPIGQVMGISPNFYDLARVEVLTGPQGTLYGRNATGGAVNLITQRPTQTLKGYVTAEYGNYEAIRVAGALNVPISDTLAVRGAFNIVDRKGYLSDGADDDVRQSARLQAYWEPNEQTNLRVFGDYSHTGGRGAGATLAPRQPGTDAWTSITDPINNAALAAEAGGLNRPFTNDVSFEQNQWSVHAELNAKLGDFATLTVIPGYRDLKVRSVNNSIGLLLVNDPLRTKQTTFEARLGNQSDVLKWTVGGFFFRDKTFFDQFSYPLADFATAFINSFNTNSRINAENRSYALFGEATYSIMPEFRVIGGARYTKDRVSFSGFYIDTSINPNPLSPFPLGGVRHDSALTWKGGFEFDVTPTSMLYFTAARGYKSGGFFYSFDANDNRFEPEKLTAFDLGIRNRFFDNTLQVNLSAFYWKYRDQQVTALGFTESGVIAYATRNVGDADPRGLTADIVWQPTPNDTLTLNANYNRARYKKFVINYPAPLVATLAAGPLCTVPTTPVGVPPVLPINCAGAPLPRTPSWSGSASYQHVFQLANEGKVAANVAATAATARYLSADFYTPASRDRGYVLLNADLTYTAPQEAFTVTAFIRNITNNAVYQGSSVHVLNGFGAITGGAPTQGYSFRTIGAPRTYGVRATVNF